jgi:drug/metabolite transporter (DMT)-like permease
VSAVPLWFLFALLTAVAWAGLDALCKRALRAHPPRAVLGARWWYALPFLALPLLAAPVPPLDRVFWLALLVSGPLEVFAMFLYLEAIAVSPLSLTAPLLAWTPVFAALAAAVVLGETPSPAGAAGVLLVAAGSWLLYSSPGCGALAPLRCLARERGARLTLAVALIFSATSALGKLGMQHSSTAFFGPAYVACLAVCLGAAAILRGEGRAFLRELRPNRWFLAIGAAAALMTLLHFSALALTSVAYMLAVKRSSLLVSVAFGRVFFQERGLIRRIPGAAVMFAGVLLLGLWA